MPYEFAGAYDAAVLDTNSQLLKLVAFELVTEPGAVLAVLYTDRLRTATVAQPFLSDAEGNVHLFTDPGRYRLRQVGSPPGEQITVQPDPDETEGELEAHVVAADPHPVYLTTAEGAAAFDPTGTAAAGDVAHVAAGDPHPVYLTAAEGNAAYAPIGEPVSGAHVADPTDAHDASAVSFVPGGSVAATDVQTAVDEVALDYIAADASHVAAGDPHPVYLTQTEGDARYTQPAAPLTTGSVLFVDSNGEIAQDNANLFWDDATNRLHVGTRPATLGTSVLDVYSVADTYAASFIFDFTASDVSYGGIRLATNEAAPLEGDIALRGGVLAADRFLGIEVFDAVAGAFGHVKLSPNGGKVFVGGDFILESLSATAVSLGANDSGGVGFRVLRVPN